MLARKSVPLLMLFAAVGACQTEKNGGIDSHAGFVRDSARVVSVDPSLGQVVLDLHGEHVRAFWQTELLLAQEGSVSRQEATGLPVAQYKEPLVKQQALKAAPGDVIRFVGLWTGNQIFLRSVAVVEH